MKAPTGANLLFDQDESDIEHEGGQRKLEQGITENVIKDPTKERKSP